MPPTFTPRMTADELSLISKIIFKKHRVLEFGSGGSTLFFLEKGVQKCISVESDRAWLEGLAAHPAVAAAYAANRWLPLHADIGEVREWGGPAAKTPQYAWLNYHQNCWGAFAERKFDRILIDGRFRVACLCQCLLRCALEKTLFLMHDFWNRPSYHSVLAFLDPVARADTLGVFAPKPDCDWRAVSLLLQERQFIPD